MRSTTLYAPDGMTSAGSDPMRFVGTTANEHQDDGLVHNHGWATSGKVATVAMAASGGMFSTKAPSWSPGVAQVRDHAAMPAQDRHDDGLVHNHAWAVSGK